MKTTRKFQPSNTTGIFKEIASVTSYIRILRNVKVDKVNGSATYYKLGVLKSVTGDKFERLKDLVTDKTGCFGRYAIGILVERTNQSHIIMDRVFYDEF